MKKLISLLIVSLFLISFTSAGISKSFVEDKTKSTQLTKYGTVTLKDKSFLDVFGWFEKDIATITLKENTESCGENCYAIKEITLLEDGKLVDGVKFETILEDGSRVEQPIRSYQFYIQDGEDIYEKDIFEWQCSPTGKINSNGTAEQKCINVKVGVETIEEPIWKPYLYEEIKAGTYTIKLEGSKKPSRKVDWIITSQGKEIKEWAVWGISEENYYFGDNTATDGTGSSYRLGILVYINNTISLKKVGFRNAVASAIRISDGSGSSLNTSTSKDGNNFTIGYQLLADNYYMIEITLPPGTHDVITNYGASLPIQANNDFQIVELLENEVNRTGINNFLYEPLSLTYDRIRSSITLNLPTDAYSSPTNEVTFNATATIVGEATLTNMSLWIDGEFNETQDITGTTNTSIWTKTLSEGSHNWTVQACDSDGDCAFSSTNKTVIIDSTQPSITLNYPTSLINYGYYGEETYLNFTVTDLNLDSCWYDYNGTNITASCSSGVLSENLINLTTQKNVIIYANDTAGNTNSSFFSWDYKVFENSQTYNNQTIEGSIESFYINLTLADSYEIISGIFNYNTSTETASIDSSGNNRILSISNFEIPYYISSVNQSFYWNLNLDDGTIINTTSKLQTVNTIGLDNCSTYTNQIFNLSLFDEEFKTPINGDIELFYEIKNVPNYNTIKNLSGKFENINNTLICSDINLTNQNVVYSSEIKYSADNYESELYHIQRGNINQLTSINLFDLKSNDSTKFVINYQDDNLIKVEEAIIQLQRKYISENIYETVEAPLTSNEGQAIVHVDLDSNKYKIIVVKNGEILDIFDNIVFNCESELSGICEQGLYGSIDPQNDIPIENTLDFSYTIGTSNGTIELTFSVPSGVPSNINIQLVQKDQFGTTNLCNKTVISSSGSIECTYNNSIGDSYLDLQVSKDSIPQIKKSYVVEENRALTFLNNNFFIVFIMLLSIVGMAFSSPEWIIVNSVITLFISGALFLLNGVNFVVGLGSMMWLIIAGAILIMKISKQEDR